MDSDGKMVSDVLSAEAISLRFVLGRFLAVVVNEEETYKGKSFLSEGGWSKQSIYYQLLPDVSIVTTMIFRQSIGRLTNFPRFVSARYWPVELQRGRECSYAKRWQVRLSL